MENAHKAPAHDQTIDAILLAALADTAMSAVAIKTGEEIIDDPILSATSALTLVIVAHTKVNPTNVQDPIRAIRAGRAAPGHARPHQKSNKNIHRAPPTTTNSSKATMNTSRATKTRPASVARLPRLLTVATVITTTAQKAAIPSRSGLAMTVPKSNLLPSGTSHACQTVASLKVRARSNARKLASGQRSPTIPKKSSATSSQPKKL